MRSLAHILSGSSGTAPIVWVPAIAALVGVVCFAFGRGRRRSAGRLVAIAGFGAVLAVDILSPGAPVRPAYSIVVAWPKSGQTTGDPVVLAVCGRYRDGSRAQVPGSGQVLSVSIDGVQQLTATQPVVALTAPGGRHMLRAEILTGDHRRFDPPLAVDVTLTVRGPQPVASPPPCPG